MINKKYKKNGFTLIEIVVVLAMTAIIMAAVVGALISTFRANNKVSVINKVTQNGNWALDEMKKNVLNARTRDMLCPIAPGVGTSLTFTNVGDGESTTFVCIPPQGGNKGKIASVSALHGTIDLTSIDEVSVIDCSNFVTCNPSQNNVPGDVNFRFILSSGVPTENNANYAEKEFRLKVAGRN